MADSQKFSIATEFAQGVASDRLGDELEAAWPPDLAPVGVSVTGGRPGVDGVVRGGSMVIHTARAFDRDEDTTRANVFALHIPTPKRQVVRLVNLRPAPKPGFDVWVDDAPRAGTGLGCRCYYDDRDHTWRRMSDDGIVAVV
jgi:hypothetical protein